MRDRGGASLSLEYAILGIQNADYRPEPWEPVHSLTWAHVMAWDLRSNLEHEIERSMVAGSVGADRVQDLYPPHTDDHPVIVGDGMTAALLSGSQRWMRPKL
jgi:penicillin amidase